MFHTWHDKDVDNRNKERVNFKNTGKNNMIGYNEKVEVDDLIRENINNEAQVQLKYFMFPWLHKSTLKSETIHGTW